MSQLFSGKDNVSTHWKHAKGMSLRYGDVGFEILDYEF